MPPAKSLNGPAPGIPGRDQADVDDRTTTGVEHVGHDRVASVRRPRTPRSRSAAGTRAPGCRRTATSPPAAPGPWRPCALGAGAPGTGGRPGAVKAALLTSSVIRPQCRAGLIHQPGHVVAVGQVGADGHPHGRRRLRSRRPSRRWCRAVCRSHLLGAGGHGDLGAPSAARATAIARPRPRLAP